MGLGGGALIAGAIRRPGGLRAGCKLSRALTVDERRLGHTNKRKAARVLPVPPKPLLDFSGRSVIAERPALLSPAARGRFSADPETRNVRLSLPDGGRNG